MVKKPKIFYGAQKLAQTNETALQAVKRVKALQSVKETQKKIGKVMLCSYFDVNIFVLLLFYFQIEC